MATTETPANVAIRPFFRERRRLLSPGLIFFYLGSAVLAVGFVFPFFWAISSSFKTIAEINTFPPALLPAVPQFQNFAEVFAREPYGLWVKNSLIVVVLSTVGALLSSSLVAYSFARFRYRGRDILFIITLGTLMLPVQVTLIPQFILFHELGWVNTLAPLWVPAWFGGGGFSIFLLRQFIMTIPRDLDEAATADGANPFQVYWSILLPLCKPALSALAILWFISGWNDFLGPVIYLNTPDMFTVAIGLSAFAQVPGGGGQLFQHLLMAAAVMAIIPPIAIFLAAQRYFVQGVVLTGIKG
jgi:ABC-type glycerol-3-phosphate transport system permease component